MSVALGINLQFACAIVSCVKCPALRNFSTYFHKQQDFRKKVINMTRILCDFDRASSLICGNKTPTICNRGFYCRYYCLLNMFRAPLCPSSGAQEYYTVLVACGISCCSFQVAGLVWSWGLCVRFAGCCSILSTWKPQHEIPQAATTV